MRCGSAFVFVILWVGLGRVGLPAARQTSVKHGFASGMFQSWAGMLLHMGFLIHGRALGKLVFFRARRPCIKVLGVMPMHSPSHGRRLLRQ